MPDVSAGPPWPPCHLHELIAAQADRTPGREAVRCADRWLTYRELLTAARAVADRLEQRGVGAGDRVAVSINRSTDLPVALLGVLLSGAAFVPVDPFYPLERQAHMLRDSGARLTLTVGRLADQVRTAEVLLLDDPHPGAAPAASHGPARQTVAPEGLAYLMYTSGSTGAPKAVAVDHRCLVKGVLAMMPVVRPEPADVWLSLTSASFDPVLLDLFLPLVSGGSVVIAQEEHVLDGPALGALVDSSGATVLQATPLAWSMLLDGGWSGRLRVALCGGEPLPPSLAAALCLRSQQVWNIYGPTETTIWSTAHLVTSADQRSVPVGRPLPDTTVHVLDEQRRPLAPGELGEVWIGGGGVTRGYFGRPELTQQHFVADPFGEAGDRLYRTGDLGRFNADGALELLGRADHQIKIRGHRVEPGEIENWLAQEPSVAEAVVLLGQDTEQQRLVAYVRPKRGSAINEAQLRPHAAARLPRHMLPALYRTVDTWPRTPNGKVDRRALAAPTTWAPRDDDGPKGAQADNCVAGAQDEVANALAHIWRDVLGAPPPDLESDFFAMGGTSLDIMRLSARIRARFGVRMNTARLMRAATLADHAALVKSATAAAPAVAPQS